MGSSFSRHFSILPLTVSVQMARTTLALLVALVIVQAGAYVAPLGVGERTVGATTVASGTAQQKAHSDAEWAVRAEQQHGAGVLSIAVVSLGVGAIMGWRNSGRQQAFSGAAAA